MNKKYLLGQNAQLLATLENERQKCKGLEIKNSELTALLNLKDKHNAELKNKLSETELLLSQLVAKNSELSSQISNKTQADADPQEIKQDEPPIPLVASEKIQPVSLEKCSTEAEEYGAKSIGRIAVKAAILSNLLAASGDNNAHDLLTLTLGRTEVFKGEVLSVVRADNNFTQKCEAIDKLEGEVLEYFNNLKGQL